VASTAAPAAAMPTESAVLATAPAMLGEPAALTFPAVLAEPAMLTFPAVLAELVMLTFPTVLVEPVMLKTAAPVAVIKIEQTIARIVGVSAVGVSAVDVTLTLCRASGTRC